MIRKINFILILLVCSLPFSAKASPETELLIENAILMNIHHEASSALRKELNAEIVQYDCSKITDIELIRLPSGSKYLSEGHAFKLTVQMRAKVINEWKLVTMTLENDNPQGAFISKNIQISVIPKNYNCGKKLYP